MKFLGNYAMRLTICYKVNLTWGSKWKYLFLRKTYFLLFECAEIFHIPKTGCLCAAGKLTNLSHCVILPV